MLQKCKVEIFAILQNKQLKQNNIYFSNYLHSIVEKN